MRNYAYNIINKSGKESICEKQEYWNLKKQLQILF
jgi:hypothetical protein